MLILTSQGSDLETATGLLKLDEKAIKWMGIYYVCVCMWISDTLKLLDSLADNQESQSFLVYLSDVTCNVSHSFKFLL